MRDAGSAPCGHTMQLVDARLVEIQGRLDELQATQAALRRLRQRLARLDPAECDPAGVCSAI
ncbi:hypothetical protein [Euzebya sp.]|uniref:hypothetical protein n=1 Tax=Euzebya sp. TaxID=1971409 RepID=UPI00351682F2